MKKTVYIFFFATLFMPNLYSVVDRITNQNPVLNELSDKTYLYEVTRYLYRWYLEDEDIKKCHDSKNIVFLIRELRYKLDKDDKSIFAEMVIPRLGIVLKLKKSDYFLEEQNIHIQSNLFKIVSISRVNITDVDIKEFKKTEIELAALIKYLTATRTNSVFPDKEILLNLESRLMEQAEDAGKSEILNVDPKFNDIFYLAPLSPVSNEIWIYWVGAKILIHCKTEMNINNPFTWESEGLQFYLYDAYKNTYISLGQTSLSNQHMTVHQVGRTLYNCMVLGKRISTSK